MQGFCLSWFPPPPRPAAVKFKIGTLWWTSELHLNSVVPSLKVIAPLHHFEPWETIVCWHLRGNHHSRVSQVVQDFAHPQYEPGSQLGAHGQAAADLDLLLPLHGHLRVCHPESGAHLSNQVPQPGN